MKTQERNKEPHVRMQIHVSDKTHKPIDLRGETGGPIRQYKQNLADFEMEIWKKYGNEGAAIFSIQIRLGSRLYRNIVPVGDDNNTVYIVTDRDRGKFDVKLDMDNRTVHCTCEHLLRSKTPCWHAVAVLHSLDKDGKLPWSTAREMLLKDMYQRWVMEEIRQDLFVLLRVILFYYA